MKNALYSIIIIFIFSGQSYAEDYAPKYKILKESFLPDGEIEKEWNSIPLESLTLSRSGCHGVCPEYTVTLLKGGKAEFKGIAYTKIKGVYSGEVGLYQYALLTSFIERTSFMELQHSYHADWPDDERVTLKLILNGKEKIISDYGHQAPPEFQAFIALFEKIDSDIVWKKVKK